jgi:hypothetical protein
LGSFALGIAPIAAKEDQAPEMSAADVAALQQAVDLGWKIHAYDQAAWRGTDAALEDLSDAAKQGVAGWIINEVGDGWETVFFRRAGEGYEAAWAGVYDGEKVIRRTTYTADERVLTTAETALVTATQLARSQRVEVCSTSRPNTVVFPNGKPDGGHYAYVLTPQEKTGEIPFGGHHRFEIVDGQIKASRQFTNSCLTIAAVGDDGKRPEALSVTHLLDPVPTEIHVFSVYAAGVPVYVLTASNKTAWAVEVSGGKPRIRRIK